MDVFAGNSRNSYFFVDNSDPTDTKISHNQFIMLYVKKKVIVINILTVDF